MTKRPKIVAGNWKMNLLQNEAKLLAQSLNNGVQSIHNDNLIVLVFPGFTLLNTTSQSAIHFQVGAQNFYPEKNGAYTGEVSIEQLQDLNLKYALVGHSERRIIFSESNTLVRSKLLTAIDNDITPILCIGETSDIRDQKQHFQYIASQLKDALNDLNPHQVAKIIIAYEPVWAIGTGITATAQQAEEMHAFIRNWFAENFNIEIANSIPIIYGGSCNDSNALELFSCPNVDGGLIGGASLNVNQFLSIIKTINGLS